ncbi:MAG: hypothetical protein QHC90_04160 [Shinella sp.]|jgi:hypothetical protein|nr:hypothetical protein [Shinella sp.]
MRFHRAMSWDEETRELVGVTDTGEQIILDQEAFHSILDMIYSHGRPFKLDRPNGIFPCNGYMVMPFHEKLVFGFSLEDGSKANFEVGTYGSEDEVKAAASHIQDTMRGLTHPR